MSDKSLTLFEVAREYREQAETLYDMELDEQTIADTLESLPVSDDLTTKVMNVVYVWRNLGMVAQAKKAAAAELAAQSKAIEARQEHIKAFLLNAMQLTRMQKITSAYGSAVIRDNPPSVVIDEPGLVPAEFMRQPEPPPPAPDKKAIAPFLKSLKPGETVTWAHLSTTQRVDIK